ncbi:MAG: DegT/DnrJ/EryC1/StrS family aminotransferase [Candidatus Edwardsbacteria bacterium]|nr:DegT/DnrJ/EryC1/StrS family aminotransferase [Candidatus Edwardsbacteria bacterium]MBU1575728.1 DegT/DnrJ/EryC1/StrS family aminotransferase [Candidatus Edwardsbacteria bacterium]MBU2462571.1 DegT/DnrJ/EryC1/StrS family aminotransferase [Candidatus Edwardsbacteria bacterium]MBU2594222.1 DegT/DnrJ/EryC1/StrS family aminotransferase [Candidatus Edwardsbacteria bacterium]
MIKLANPDITSKEIAAVVKVLKSGTLSLGPELEAFEKDFARYVGRKYALAVSSGTAGLHMAANALGIGPGDEVITSPYSFIASVNCILYQRAKPVLADIDPTTFNLDPQQAAAKVNSRTKALLAVDIFGLPADYKKLNALCRKHNLELIEDSCEALGARHHGRMAGSFGKISVFGFYPNKQITTGEGGMVLCDDPRIHRQMAALRNQGRSSMGGWLAHHILGYNYRMSDISAALGRVQLARLPAMLERRRRVAQNYKKLFARHLPEFTVLQDVPGVERSWFVFAVLAPPNLKGKKRDHLIKGLQRSGIQCAHYFPALHLQPALRSLGYKKGDFPVAEDVASRSLALPFHHKLTGADQIRIVETIRRII